MFVDRDGTVWVAGNHELYALRRGSRTFTVAAAGLGGAARGVYIVAMAQPYQQRRST